MRRVLIALSALLLASCVQDAITDVAIDLADTDKIYASIGEVENRVELNKDVQLVWTAEDRLIVAGPNTFKRYKFDGKTGDKSGTFTRTNTYTVLDVDLDRYYATAYCSTQYGITNNRLRLYSPSSGTQVQEYNPNGCGAVNAAMVFGVSDDGKNFTFRNLMGYLRISLTGEKTVQSIQLINNSGDNISGRYYVYVDKPETVTWYSSSSPQPTILLDCKEGVQLSSEPTDFYFIIKPMELTEGVTLNVAFTDGTTFVQSTTKAITIAQNRIQPMAVISTLDGRYQRIGLKFKGKSFTMPTVEGLTSLSGYVDLGDGTISILNHFTTYEYTDEKEEHSVTIKLLNATKFEVANCKGIIELDLSNF